MFETKLVWIEEETNEEMSPIKSYLKATLEYSITIIDNASDAESYFASNQCHVILLDIRIPPGASEYWCDLHKTNERLGLKILVWLKKNFPNTLNNLGVFTNESWSNISDDLLTLNITEDRYLQKQKATSSAVVKNFIDSIKS